MQILCSGGKVFTVLTVDKESTAVLNLLCVYYVFDIKYPAVYGFLSVMESLVLNKQPHSIAPDGGTASKRRKRGPVATGLQKFLQDFEKFKKETKISQQQKAGNLVSDVSAAAVDCADDLSDV